MRKVTPFLWFDNNAEEAMKFYVSVFRNAKIINPGAFEIDGQQFLVLNGGPEFKFNEAISLFVNCDNQEEVDELWEKLSAGGEKSKCGWLKDKFGLSWQVIPSVLMEMLNDNNPEKSKRVLNAMLKMSKINIEELKAAYNKE
jgi:predicted 3-demethylubiquinone-9 3-methyltransferase (glyoxalase superfamily)